MNGTRGMLGRGDRTGRQAGGPRLLLRETSGRGMTLSLSPWLKQNPSDPHSIKKKKIHQIVRITSILFLFYLFLAALESMWDLRSPTRD